VHKANEPEASRARCRALDLFIHDAETFLLDYGQLRAARVRVFPMLARCGTDLANGKR
jgi:hypothetical protein